MERNSERTYAVFVGSERVASGSLPQVVEAAKSAIDRGVASPVLIFDALTSEQIEVDFRGSLEQILGRLPMEVKEEGQTPSEGQAHRSPGRPKLGVIAREVTLLPRHWDWLATQPGGASVALRKLVEQARRTSGDADRVRLSRESAYRFMSAMAGNESGFEEATRALFAGNKARFEEMVESWPAHVREHARHLATAAF